jgi:hypothetical protein
MIRRVFFVPSIRSIATVLCVFLKNRLKSWRNSLHLEVLYKVTKYVYFVRICILYTELCVCLLQIKTTFSHFFRTEYKQRHRYVSLHLSYSDCRETSHFLYILFRVSDYNNLPFEAADHLYNSYKSSPYLKENTTLLHYIDQLVNAV